jgi:hypothetical protein
MKNLYLIPTDKPSRLIKFKDETNLLLSSLPSIKGQGFNIYITNDEKIKEGDWYIKSNTNLPTKRIHLGNNLYKDDKKIVLTTDQDLIKDGVQSIENDFLKWFVNNPSCEYVEIESNYRVKSGTIEEHKQGVAGYEYYEYKIIISNLE